MALCLLVYVYQLSCHKDNKNNNLQKRRKGFSINCRLLIGLLLLICWFGYLSRSGMSRLRFTSLDMTL